MKVLSLITAVSIQFISCSHTHNTFVPVRQDRGEIIYVNSVQVKCMLGHNNSCQTEHLFVSAPQRIIYLFMYEGFKDIVNSQII
jgi:hypothetical protein